MLEFAKLRTHVATCLCVLHVYILLCFLHISACALFLPPKVKRILTLVRMWHNLRP